MRRRHHPESPQARICREADLSLSPAMLAFGLKDRLRFEQYGSLLVVVLNSLQQSHQVHLGLKFVLSTVRVPSKVSPSTYLPHANWLE